MDMLKSNIALDLSNNTPGLNQYQLMSNSSNPDNLTAFHDYESDLSLLMNETAEYDNDAYPDSFEDFPYPIPLKDTPLPELILKVVFSAIIILASLVGNLLVIIIVWRNRRMRTTTNYYIVNLAVADLLITCMCSWVHVTHDVTEGWVLGAFFCKVNSFGQVLALVSSILTLTLIACDRFFGIVFAMRAHLTERRATGCILMVWACAVGVASPLLVFREQQSRRWADHLEIWCADEWPIEVVMDGDEVVGTVHKGRTVYYTVVCVVLFFLPILVMATAYSCIVWRLWSSDLPGEHVESGKAIQDKVKKKVALMLVVLLCVFVLCWLPLQVCVLYAEYRSSYNGSLPDWFSTFQYITTFIAYSNSALNPIIYAGFNDNFRRGFRNLFHIAHPDRRYSSIGTSTTYFRRDSVHTTMVTKI